MINKLLKPHTHNIDKTKKDVITRGTNRINDMIAPDSITNEKNFYALGDTLVRTLMVTGYPKLVYMGWLEELYSYDANIDISTHITPWDTTKVIKTLGKRIGQYTSTLNMDAKNEKVTDIEIETALEDAEELRDKLHTGSSKFFYQAIYISLSAKYIEDLDQLTDDIESLCGGVQMTTRPAVYRQDEAFLSVLPIGNDRIRKTRNFDTESLSTCFPLVSAELTDMRGDPILYGINQVNNSLVMFDRFKLPNYNSITLATSGSGKSYTVKLESLRYFLMGTKVIIIDPQGEYKSLCESVNGQYIELATNSPDRINPLDIHKDIQMEDGQKSFLSAKTMDIYLLLQVMLGKERSAKLTNNEKRDILGAIQDAYKKFGITQEGFTDTEEDELIVERDFITIGSNTQQVPTLSDLDAALKERGGDGLEIAQELEPYINGVMNIFNGETNVNLDNDFVVFGIKNLEESMRELAMFVCLEYIWNKVKSGNEKTLITADEAWILMRNKSSAMFLEKVTKTARKFNTGISLVTQNVGDFINNGGESIVTNTSMQILLRQNPNELKYLEESLGVTESEQLLLRSLNIGEALVYAGQNKTLIDVVSNDFEYELCNTTAEG